MGLSVRRRILRAGDRRAPTRDTARAMSKENVEIVLVE